METTNKRIAFYTAIIGTILSVLLPAFGLQITPEQQETLITAMLLVCAAFGIGDIGYDWINAAKPILPRTTVNVKETENVVVESPATVAPFINVSNPPASDKLNNDLSAAG